MMEFNVWRFVKDIYFRITLSRYTAFFFVFSFIHCFTIGITQSFTYSVDSSASSFIHGILNAAGNPQNAVFAVLLRNGTLQHCDATPIEKHTSPCHNIFDPSFLTTPVPQGCPAGEVFSSSLPMTFEKGPEAGSVILAGGHLSCNITLSNQCINTLVYPDQVLQNMRREDLALVGSQFWLFCLSLYSILYTSVPHLIAAYCVRILGMAWSSYIIWRTTYVRRRMDRLIANGPCGVDLFPDLWKTKRMYEIPELALSAVSLIVCTFLTYRLYRTYSRKVYARVGVTDKVWKIYKLFLALFVNLQLSAFFLVTAMGLWIDQLSHGAIASFSSFTPVYRALFISTCILLIPWVILGWCSVRREFRRVVFAFLALGFVFIACWALMFYSQVYRWTFVQWPFFGCVTTASFIVLVVSFVLGAVCTRHFGYGFAQFVYAENRLARADFEPELFSRDVEKVPHYPEESYFSEKRRPSATSLLAALPSLPTFKHDTKLGQ